MHDAGAGSLGASLALGARIVLALVLVFSGTAKLRARSQLRAQVQSLMGAAAAPVIAAALPFAELAVAAGLLVWWSAIPGAIALALFGAFTVVLVRAQSRRLPCPCFGAARPEAPVGPSAIVRNGVLAATAVMAIGSPAGASVAATIAAVVVMGAVAGGAVWISR